ncbi:CPBP family intramembrane glutamic endopeptidase [Streptococcus pantholopis]|uniref:CAAX protease n=1 Tax=Streptococcus pantholopis TaxID=1811193 RepID=A0A172Q944_9STRE|nr:CPBP family intramembrane glutamic endopeptidase [Streptococcus pantholopis]AND80023.1 CAAX protease [Streptococcus pantholopis]
MNRLQAIRGTKKIRLLKWWDILILTLILFFQAIQTSFAIFFTLEDGALADVPEFTSAVNWQAFLHQSFLLFLAFLYLWLRHFDFSVWTSKIRITPRAIFMGVGIFIGFSLIFDLYLIGTSMLMPPTAAEASVSYAATPTSLHPLLQRLSEVDLSLLVFSALNGFYEEIFFLGVCLTVKAEHRRWALLYSLIVRYAFHTYQGNIPALGIGILMGTVYYVLYARMKEKNLFPFFLGHAISDVMGLGILGYFWWF